MKKQMKWLIISAALILTIIGICSYFTMNLRARYLNNTFHTLKSEMHIAATQIHSMETSFSENLSEITGKISIKDPGGTDSQDLLSHLYNNNSFIERIILKDSKQFLMDINNRYSQDIYEFNDINAIVNQDLVQQKKVSTHGFEKTIRIVFIMPLFNQSNRHNLIVIIDPEKIFKSVFANLYVTKEGQPWVLCHSGKVKFLLCNNCFEFTCRSTKSILSDFAIRQSGEIIANGRLPNQKQRSAQKLLTSYIPISFFGTNYMLGYMVSKRSVLGIFDTMMFTILGIFIMLSILVLIIGGALIRSMKLSLNRELALKQSIEESRDEAILANQTKTDFITNMSHEIRTPMNGILGMNALLLDTRLDSTQYQYAQTIKNSAHSLLAIINDILDFSNIETGQIHLEANAFNLRNTIEDFSDMMASRAFEKGLDYAAFIPYDIPVSLVGDPNRLRQILLNLVSNAIKYTDKGEVVVEVAMEDETETHLRLRFTISDTGLGVPKERMARLFKPFSQVDLSLTRDYGGIGLGLIISKQLVEKMDGEIGMTSVERKGSKFWFTIKFQKDNDKQDTFKISEHLIGLNAMIVDHQLTCRKLLKHHLHHWQCEVTEAEDGISALDKLKQAHLLKKLPDFMIVSYHLPGMDGKTLSKAIRKDPSLRSIPLIMLASMLNHEHLQNYKTYGFVSYFKRPVKIKHMQKAVLQAIGHDDSFESEKIIQTQSGTESPASVIVEDAKFKGLFVLIVEDNLVNQQVTENMLLKLGCQSKIAENGLEALEMLEKRDFDLVLMDIQMPKMDGLTATRNIRSTQSQVRNHDIPIIAMTAHALKGHKEKCFDAGMNDFLTKPLSIDSLVRAIDKTGIQPSYHTEPEKEVEKQVAQKNDTQQKQSDPNIFDRNSLMDRVGGNEAILENIVQLFLKETPKQIGDLEARLASNNMEEATNVAHSIKGSAGNFGATQMREVAYSLEKYCRDNHIEKANEAFIELKGCFDTLKDYMT